MDCLGSWLFTLGRRNELNNIYDLNSGYEFLQYHLQRYRIGSRGNYCWRNCRKEKCPCSGDNQHTRDFDSHQTKKYSIFMFFELFLLGPWLFFRRHFEKNKGLISEWSPTFQSYSLIVFPLKCTSNEVQQDNNSKMQVTILIFSVDLFRNDL